MRLAQENERVLLISRDHKEYLVRLRRGDLFHTHRGVVAHDDLIDKPLGREVLSRLGQPFMVLQPSIYDLLLHIKRTSQILFPKEIGQILLRLDVANCRKIIEAGTGSGALTTALAQTIGDEGIVYSYEAREDMLDIARKNLEACGLLHKVRLLQRDISEGFTETEADALFLDVREPWLYLRHVCTALADGGFFGALVPTTNQISWLLNEFERFPFTNIEVIEILERHYKPVASRLRPEDRMTAHTGYLIFARKIAGSLPERDSAPGEGYVTPDDLPPSELGMI
ncbi:MAG: tRNA (adenine-N1)-methyltransferase [Chloroflexi bacterium]|nr:tRNA (adenine-N1)-methyltransferase [Chloroflexota bacterium]